MVTEIDESDASTRDEPLQPVVFISHGAPNIVLRDNSFTRALQGIPATLPEPPSGVVVFSAHWESPQPTVTAGSPDPNRPYETIHDFWGFDPELYRISYPAYGSPGLVGAVENALAGAALPVRRHSGRGLDHGAWVPLRLMWPHDPPPIVQVSINASAPPAEQYAIGRALAALRRDGVLIMGSGGTVHNLGIIEPEETPTRPWAVEFDDWLLENLARGDRDALFDYSRLAPHAGRAVPRAEHFVNFFLALGAAHPGENAADATAANDADALAKATVLDRSYLFGALSMLTLTFS
jgi:4,5-DOPA dioxygenase extradiol